MIRKVIVAFILIASLLAFFFFTDGQNNASTKAAISSKTDSGLTESESQLHFSRKKVLATDRLKALYRQRQACYSDQESAKDTALKIHGMIVSALEKEIRNGATIGELYQYKSQYSVYFESFKDLIILAKIRVEEEKYQLTDKLEIVDQWMGMEVLPKFAPEKRAKTIERLLEYKDSSVIFTVKLADSVAPQDIKNLIKNNGNFNTYLKMRNLHLASKDEDSLYLIPYISPSLLFIKVAEQLSFSEFKQAIRNHRFTVNEIAVAMLNNLSFEYLEALLQQTDNIGDFPITANFDRFIFENLADIAAYKHQVKLLHLLEEKGIQATNLPGLVTGLDLATQGIFSNLKSNIDQATLEDYLETLEFFNRRGYPMHAREDAHQDEMITWYGSEYTSIKPSRALQNNVLQQKLNSLIKITPADYSKQKPSDESEISKVIQQANQLKFAREQYALTCEDIGEAIIEEEGYKTSFDFRTFRDSLSIKATVDEIFAELQAIDPTLVDLWMPPPDVIFSTSDRDKIPLLQLLDDQDVDALINYVSQNPLSSLETAYLFQYVFQKPEIFMVVWHARIDPKLPTNMHLLRRSNYEKWFALVNEGFDFSIFTVEQKRGRDIFTIAALESQELVELLLDNGYQPGFKHYGVDSLDVVLDDSYEKGNLNPNYFVIKAQIPELESSHISRMARLKMFFPQAYAKLQLSDEEMARVNSSDINRYHKDITKRH
ncbi:hypothetical protein [Glaciecola sp. 1036]|uniref:hypothetical protein n=1 Tax=Alteromonadaceae TaxID=72275 RepID=UPI003D00FCEB